MSYISKPDSYTVANLLMYQKRRDDTKFNHITTTQRVLWDMYCYHKQVEQKEIISNYVVTQMIQARMKQIIKEAQLAQTTEEKQALLNEASLLEKRLTNG